MYFTGIPPMSIESPTSDSDFLDLLRAVGPLSVAELAGAMEVTATAVRQRLTRMMSQGVIQRDAHRKGRGRPLHRYALTDKGLRLTGSNFTDLAMTLWTEIRGVDNPEFRREMLRRIAHAMAAKYASQVEGKTPAERLRSLADLLAKRRISVSVDDTNSHPVLNTHSCPYPNLAEHDQSVCSMERMMFTELVGEEVKLTQCRLEGDPQCRFQAG
jgi:DeoR family transcriptional regulator, suf operon transcriptional repressor